MLTDKVISSTLNENFLFYFLKSKHVCQELSRVLRNLIYFSQYIWYSNKSSYVEKESIKIGIYKDC